MILLSIGLTLMVAASWLVSPFVSARESLRRFVVPFSVGVAMAYVFVDIFPHLVSLQKRLGPQHELLAQYLYTLMLMAFSFHLGVKQLAEVAPKHGHPDRGVSRERLSRGISLGSILIYAFLIGSLLSEQGEKRASGGVLYAIAMTLHVLGLGTTLQHTKLVVYTKGVQWSLATAVVLGWVVEQFVGIGPFYNASLYALIGGQIIVLAAVFELPNLRDLEDYGLFLLGVLAFGGLIEGTRILVG